MLRRKLAPVLLAAAALSPPMARPTTEEPTVGVIIAGEIAVANLAAISANIGIITAGQLRNTGNSAGVNLGGAGGIPGPWGSGINFESGATVSGMSRYLNFAATGSQAFIFSEKFEARVDGVAIFRGLAQETDTDPKFKIDFPNKLLTITDEQTPTARERLKIGKLAGAATDYGIQLFDQNGTEIFRVYGSPATSEKILMNSALIGGLGSGHGVRLGAPDSSPQIWFIASSVIRWFFAADVDGLALSNDGSNTRWFDIVLNDARLRFHRSAANTVALKPDTGDALHLDDGSTNTAKVGSTVVSTSSPSGDYPEGTFWAKV